MACNTASAHAIRPWQEKYPNRKVLSVTVPGVEAIKTQ
jgi:glutamate racemase